MSRETWMLGGLLFVALSGCGAMEKGHVDPRVAAQVMVTKNEPPAGCAFLGPITGSTLVVGGLEEARGDVIRNAVLSGGNYVAIDIVDRPAIGRVGGYVMSGRLFTCPGGPPSLLQARVQVASLGRVHAPIASDANEPITLPKAICEPKCSPGFACEHAICVTACNPECSAGQQCGADNTCQPAPR